MMYNIDTLGTSGRNRVAAEIRYDTKPPPDTSLRCCHNTMECNVSQTKTEASGHRVRSSLPIGQLLAVNGALSHFLRVRTQSSHKIMLQRCTLLACIVAARTKLTVFFTHNSFQHYDMHLMSRDYMSHCHEVTTLPHLPRSVEEFDIPIYHEGLKRYPLGQQGVHCHYIYTKVSHSEPFSHMQE